MEKLEFLKKTLIERKESLSVAESMTGGLLSYYLVLLPGASLYFKGGLVSYSEEVKTGILKVNPQIIRDHGVVSEETARSMAHGVKVLMKTDWSLAISGFAGSNSVEKAEETGKVAFALESKSAKKAKTAYFKKTLRKEIQYEATQFALDFLISELQ